MAADSEKPSDSSHEWRRPNVMASVASSKFCVKSSWETSYIAEGLGVSWYTARNHIENLRTKLGASSRLEAVMAAMRLGILPSE